MFGLRGDLCISLAKRDTESFVSFFLSKFFYKFVDVASLRREEFRRAFEHSSYYDDDDLRDYRRDDNGWVEKIRGERRVSDSRRQRYAK